jgi:hypothetical protein
MPHQHILYQTTSWFIVIVLYTTWCCELEPFCDITSVFSPFL